MSEPVLRCAGLRKVYGDVVAADEVGFEVAEGETYGLLGPNGAGKTTVISMLVGILARDAGEVTVDGRPHSTGRTEAKARIGYVPQELALYPDLTARENLRFFGRMYDLTGRALGQRVDDVLTTVDLRDRAGDRVSTFSGGMSRRLHIAAGLLHRPRLLVLDEPTAGVDPQSRNAILTSVQALAGEGIAVLYTTHYMDEAERLCDRVGIIDGGTLIAEGSRRELVQLVGSRDEVRLRTDADPTPAVAPLAALSQVHQVDQEEDRLQLLVTGAADLLPHLLDVTHQAGVGIRSVDVREPDLEAVFLHLTGKALRE